MLKSLQDINNFKYQYNEILHIIGEKLKIVYDNIFELSEHGSTMYYISNIEHIDDNFITVRYANKNNKRGDWLCFKLPIKYLVMSNEEILIEKKTSQII